MTAPAATAPTAGPIAPAAPRAASQPLGDRFAFADVLDTLPSQSAKAGEPGIAKHQRSSSETQEQDSSQGQAASHSLMKDGALLAALPFAVRAASMLGEQPPAPEGALSEPAAAAKAQGRADAGAPTASRATAATIGRLIGERTFHAGVSNPTGALGSRAFAADAPFAPVPLRAADRASRHDAIGDSARATASIARHAGEPATHRSGPARAAAHEAAPSRQRSEGSPTPSGARVSSSSAGRATPDSRSDGKRAEGRPSDPIPSAAMAQPQPSAALSPASFIAGAFSAPDVSSAKAADSAAPRASARAAPSASPVREIDVDLSPGGLEDVSMTMRLAGDKLSVVIRAASSHTTNSIEGARDAIADRLAAIGQPLDSLIVKQTGVNTDGNTNGNAASGDDGPGGQGSRSAQGEGSDDASARRDHPRDRGF